MPHQQAMIPVIILKQTQRPKEDAKHKQVEHCDRRQEETAWKKIIKIESLGLHLTQEDVHKVHL